MIPRPFLFKISEDLFFNLCKNEAGKHVTLCE